MICSIHRVRKRWTAYRRDTRGAAAVEMALWTLFLTVPLMNVTDLSFYAYRKMQVENAAQQAAQAAWATCSTSALQPAINNCANFSSAVTAGLHSTSLGST